MVLPTGRTFGRLSMVSLISGAPLALVLSDSIMAIDVVVGGANGLVGPPGVGVDVVNGLVGPPPCA